MNTLLLLSIRVNAMADMQQYDCAIIGGGIAGLSLAILLARDKRKVVLFEKKQYPFHKVCGEYVSNESIGFLQSAGIQFTAEYPVISKLFLTSPTGIGIGRPLDIGGIGISRYKLDNMLYQAAVKAGCIIYTNTQVQRTEFKNERFVVHFGNQQILAKAACCAYGKNSNIDVDLDRKIRAGSNNDLFIAVKHYVKMPFDSRRVEMHNFPGGYCGISAVENGYINLSYITRAYNLHRSGNSIAQMEQSVLSTNPYLKKYFSEAVFRWEKPLVISHLTFGIKSATAGNMIMLGDAAGNIAPLSGNGMSMAIQSTQLAYTQLSNFLNDNLSLQQLNQNYSIGYARKFNTRINLARGVHYSFGRKGFTDLNFAMLKLFPFMLDYVGGKLHG